MIVLGWFIRLILLGHTLLNDFVTILLFARFKTIMKIAITRKPIAYYQRFVVNYSILRILLFYFIDSKVVSSQQEGAIY